MRRTLYDADHEAFRGVVRTFISKEIVPHDAEWNAAGIVPRELFTAAGAQGLIGWAIPEESGGGGQPDFRFNTAFIEEVAAAGVAGSANGLTLTNDVTLPYFLDLTTPEQKRRWLPGIASGELITAIAMTEPGAGSDLASMATTARRDGDVYVVNGATASRSDHSRTASSGSPSWPPRWTLPGTTSTTASARSTRAS